MGTERSAATRDIYLPLLFPLQPRIVGLHANRVRIPLNDVVAIALLRCDHNLPVIFAAFPRVETIDVLPLRQRRLALQSIARTIDRRRHQEPADQHDRRAISESHPIAYRYIPARPQAATRLRQWPRPPTAGGLNTGCRGHPCPRATTECGLNTGCRAQPCTCPRPSSISATAVRSLSS